MPAAKAIDDEETCPNQPGDCAAQLDPFLIRQIPGQTSRYCQHDDTKQSKPASDIDFGDILEQHQRKADRNTHHRCCLQIGHFGDDIK